MSYPGAALTAPNGNVDFSPLLPARIILYNKETKQPMNAILKKVDNETTNESLLQALWHLLNYEIVEGGDSYPFESAFTFDQFKSYYASHDLFVLVKEKSDEEDKTLEVGDNDDVVEKANSNNNIRHYNFGKSLIGSVHIRPNFPGRSCIVANGAFLVAPHCRRFGAAQVLGSFFPTFAKMLGYKSTLFNLVFELNAPSLALWTKLRYPVVGRVACAGLLKGKKTGETIPSAASMYSIDLEEEGKVVVVPPPCGKKQNENDTTTSSRDILEFDLERDILSNISSGVFGKFLEGKF